MALVFSGAEAAPASAWDKHIASAWANPTADHLDSASLADVFVGLLNIHVGSGRHCQSDVSVSVEPTSSLSLMATMIGFPDRKECPAAIPVSILSLGLKAVSAADVQAAKAALLAALPKSCFDGILPTDTRRRAPPTHMTAWVDSHRLLTFVWEDYDPTAFTMTYVRRDLTLPDQAEQDVYARVRASILHPIPAGCLGQTH